MDFEGRNIVLVVLDSLTAFNLESYGYEKETAPFLNQLAKENIKADFAYSASIWSVPSHASIFTGMMPSEHNCTSRTMNLDKETLGEKMKDKGYATASLTTNYFINEEIGFDSGFDLFINHQAEVGAPEALKQSEAISKVQKYSESHRYFKYMLFGITALINREFKALRSGIRYLLNGKQWYADDHGAEGINRLAKKFISKKERFFTFINYMEIHSPKTVSDEKGMDAYDEAISYVDNKIKELYNSVQNEKPDTVFIITADHGESHGFYRYGNYELGGHQYAITERNIRVPLIIAGEDIDNEEIEENVSLTELHDLILGEKDLNKLGKKEVYSEYMGAAEFLKTDGKSFSNILTQFKNINWSKISKMGLKYLTDRQEVKDLHLNKSFALIDQKEGSILNTHLPNQSFTPKKKGFSETEKRIKDDRKSKLKEKYQKYL